VIATGASWSTEILGSNNRTSAPFDSGCVFTPDDVMAGRALEGPVVIYDFDHYYMGSCLAEMLRRSGHDVTLISNANAVSAWTFMNNELAEIRSRMIELGIRTELEQTVSRFENGRIELTSIYRPKSTGTIECGSLVVVGVRKPNDALYRELKSNSDELDKAGILSLRSIGDCRAPGAIVHAVYSGHECARTIDAGDNVKPVARERPSLL
jgi:dimethylamine/trimethylamine dehydrogenase